MSLESSIIFGVALLWMLALAFKDQSSLKKGDHTDYKSVIVSIGVLGTFIGIVLGLWNFNTNNIEASVPALLEGLKFAFITSIAGMTISVVLSSFQKSAIAGGDDELSVLREIKKETNLLRSSMSQEIRDLKTEISNGSSKITDEISKQVTGDDLVLFREELHKEQGDLITVLDTNFTKVSDQVSNFKESYQVESSAIKQTLEQEFEKTNNSLEKAIDVLAKGATEEIIKALETVISDFNQNLVDQFGDNFKQLNQAVESLVTWQTQFKEIVEKDYGLLLEVRESLKDSAESMNEIAKRNTEVQNVYEQLREIIDTYQLQIESVNGQLQKYAEMGTEATKAFETLSSGFEKVQAGMGEQAQAIATLTTDISNKVPESLGQLEGTLVGLTDRFAQDYEAFLGNYRKLVQ